MSSLDFPLNPVDGQEYSLNGVTYYYNAALGAWLTKLSSAPLPTAFNRQVLFNDAGLSNGSYGLVFDKSANTLFANTINVSSNMRVSGNLYIGSNTVTITDTAVMARSLFVLNDAGHMTSVPSGSTSNLAFDTANAAYAAANNVGPQIAPAFDTANAAYNAANNVGPQIAPAFNTANVAYNTTNASFAKANTALQNTSGTFAGDLTATSSLRAPIFYDSNNLSYYVDPASTSVLNNLYLGGNLSGNFTTGYQTAISNGPNGSLGGHALVNLDGYGTAVPNYPSGSWNVSLFHIGDSGRGLQIGCGYNDVTPYFRTGQGGWGSWYKFWTSGNAPGTVLQVQQTTKTDTFASSSTAWTDVTGMSVNITPKSSSSKIIVRFAIHGVTSNIGYVKLLRGSTEIAIGDASGSRIRCTVGNFNFGGDGNTTYCWTAEYIDSPATTSTLTYKLQFRHENGGSTWHVNRTINDFDSATGMRSFSSITVTEIAQ